MTSENRENKALAALLAEGPIAVPYWLRSQLDEMLASDPVKTLNVLEEAVRRLPSDRHFAKLLVDDDTPRWAKRIVGGMVLEGRPETDVWLHRLVEIAQEQLEIVQEGHKS